MNNLMSDHSMRCSAFRFSHVCLSESLWRLSSPYSNMVKTFARFSTFARGRIVGKAEEGAKEADIRRTVKKTDGRRGSLRAIRTIIQHARKNPDDEGANSSAGGRPRKLTHLEEQRVKRLVHEEVAVAVVTVKYLKKRLPFLRRVTNPSAARVPRGRRDAARRSLRRTCRGDVEAASRPHRGRIEAA